MRKIFKLSLLSKKLIFWMFWIALYVYRGRWSRSSYQLSNINNNQHKTEIQFCQGKKTYYEAVKKEYLQCKRRTINNYKLRHVHSISISIIINFVILVLFVCSSVVICNIGIRLRIRQRVISTAQVFFKRFYME